MNSVQPWNSTNTSWTIGPPIKSRKIISGLPPSKPIQGSILRRLPLLSRSKPSGLKRLKFSSVILRLSHFRQRQYLYIINSWYMTSHCIGSIILNILRSNKMFYFTFLVWGSRVEPSFFLNVGRPASLFPYHTWPGSKKTCLSKRIERKVEWQCCEGLILGKTTTQYQLSSKVVMCDIIE